MKIFWKVIVAVIAFSLLGIMIVLGTAYIKSVERHTYLADNKVLSDKYVYEEFSNGKKRVKNRATQQVILDRLEWLVTGDKADSLAVFCRKGKRGYLNCYTGEVVIPAQYERAWVFSEGLAAVMSGGKIGFIDRQGRTVIPPPWSYPVGSQEMDYLFKGGYCAVFDNARQCGLIDRNGQWKVAPRYDYIYMPEEGLRILQKGDRWGVLGDSLQILMPVEYDWLKIVPEGIVCIQGGKQQVIGKDGKTVVRPFVYDAILPLYYSTGEYFDNGEERMNRSRYFSYSVWNPKGNRYGLMDAEGKRITEALYSDIEALSDDLYLCSIEDGLYRITLNYNR